MAKKKRSNRMTLRGRWLGQRLRELREANDFTLEHVAEFMQRTNGTISRFENGVYPVRRPDMLAMLDLYGVNDPRQRDGLLKLSASVWQSGWWDGYADVSEEFVDFVWLEELATEHRLFDNTALPGILQTRAYAEAVIRTAEFDGSDDLIQRGVELRLERQKLLTRAEPPRIRSVLDEAVLRRHVGSSEIMREQLAHLVECSKLPTVSLRVLPFSAGAHESPTGAFKYYVMDDPYPDLVYAETPKGAVYIEQPDTERLAARYDRLWEKSLPEADSVEFISALTEELP
ncbi:helix-turn-helix transcriptional regulator [Nocardiopsis sp. FIRDI 009]|uniref:helix-turn-helix domain-containing protein n=1 Tax=Nocardiopsis sp. FIRDI 009 TaxID=714197 RepID=UPI000E2649BA|nr:helix-turn-helix transcriptional regulator [Nocardiopsis sp. FIRDI 009]